jgi:hypothetical protein
MVFAPAINASLLSRGLRGEQYMTASRSSPPRLDEAGTDAKIGRNAMGLTQCVTFLFEMRGIGIASQSFQRRTLAGLQMILGVMETARDQADHVYDTIESAIEEVVASKERIVVTDYSTYSNRTWTMVDPRRIRQHYARDCKSDARTTSWVHYPARVVRPCRSSAHLRA